MTTQAEDLRGEQLRALERWAVDPATAKRATRYLGAQRIPGQGTDIVQHAYLRVARKLQAGPLPHENVEAYANVAMKRVVLNMLRAKREVSYLDDLSPRDVVVAPVEIGAAEDTADLIRTSVVAMTDRELWTTSAALTWLTLASDPDRDDDLAPRPKSGKKDDWRYWTALWLAGVRDCFPNDFETDDSARRKRRSRAIERVEQRVKQAAIVVREELGQ